MQGFEETKTIEANKETEDIKCLLKQFNTSILSEMGTVPFKYERVKLENFYLQ